MPVTNHPVVGRVSWEYGSGTSLVLNSAWASANIGPVFIPQLKGVQTYGGRFSGNVQFYKPAHEQLKAAFADVEAAGLLSRIIFWDGSWVPRLKRQGSTPSNHTFATAFDINAEWNPFKQRPAAKGEKGYLQDIVPIFEKRGFLWGGRWTKSPDGMHFEVAQIISSPEKTPEASVIPKLVIIKRGQRHLIDSSILKDGHFSASPAELATALFGTTVQVSEFLELINQKPFDEKNFLKDKGRFEVYIP